MGKKLYVQEGKSCTSKKGILGPGDEAKAEFFDNGEKAVSRLIDKGVLGETNPTPKKKQDAATAPEMELSESVQDLIKDCKGLGVKSAITLFKEKGADDEEKQLAVLEEYQDDLD